MSRYNSLQDQEHEQLERMYAREEAAFFSKNDLLTGAEGEPKEKTTSLDNFPKSIDQE